MLAVHRVKEKQDKYQDFARELKKPWNMKTTVIPVLDGEPGKET